MVSIFEPESARKAQNIQTLLEQKGFVEDLQRNIKFIG